MTAVDCLTRLRVDGLTVTVDAGDLVVKPATLLTPELRGDIVANKAELMALLAAGIAARWSKTGRSWWCRCGASIIASWPCCCFCSTPRPSEEDRPPVVPITAPQTTRQDE